MSLDVRNKFLIVSPDMPCGVTWLWNFLLSVNIPLLADYATPDKLYWETHGEESTLKKEFESIQVTVPMFAEKKTFRFRSDCGFYWTHRLPLPIDPNMKVIMFIRDGRGASYSEFKRRNAGGSFESFLQETEGPLSLNVVDRWAYFYYLWRRYVPPENLLVVRFENIKTDPQPQIERVARFIGVELTNEEIENGIQSSSFKKAKAAEKQFKGDVNNQKVVVVHNRKGDPQEWKSIFKEQELRYFSGLANAVLKENEYEVIASEQSSDTRYGGVAYQTGSDMLVNEWLAKMGWQTDNSPCYNSLKQHLLATQNYLVQNIFIRLQIVELLMSNRKSELASILLLSMVKDVHQLPKRTTVKIVVLCLRTGNIWAACRLALRRDFIESLYLDVRKRCRYIVMHTKHRMFEFLNTMQWYKQVRPKIKKIFYL